MSNVQDNSHQPLDSWEPAERDWSVGDGMWLIASLLITGLVLGFLCYLFLQA